MLKDLVIRMHHSGIYDEETIWSQAAGMYLLSPSPRLSSLSVCLSVCLFASNNLARHSYPFESFPSLFFCFIQVTLPGRDEHQCALRWRTMLDPALVKGSWTKEVR